ncbi:hypothetical protein BS78_03G135100 [Paspalum vaginatum]|nr:hypothetical protein BS78_03G135100 [Paspalum vaginatum]
MRCFTMVKKVSTSIGVILLASVCFVESSSKQSAVNKCFILGVRMGISSNRQERR